MDPSVGDVNPTRVLSFGGGPMNNRLREIRTRKRVTQFKLRLSTGIHQSKISLIENGLLAPREDEMERLAKALETKPREIWGDNAK